MTNLKLSRLVKSFLRDKPGSFKYEQFLAWTKSQDSELKYEAEFKHVNDLFLAAGYLTRDFSTFDLAKQHFRDCKLVASLTPFEFKQSILIPGHRFLPVYDLPDNPWTVKLLSQTGEEIPKKVIEAPFETFLVHAQLLGKENIPIYLLEDQGRESGVGDMKGTSSKVRFTVYDLASFLQETGFKEGDDLLLVARDPVNKVFEIRKRAVYDRPNEKEIKNFVRKLDQAFGEVVDTFAASINMPLQFALAFYYLGPELYKKPAVPLGEYLRLSKKVSVKQVDGRQLFWSGESPLFPEEAGYPGMLNEALALLGISLSEEELEAYMRDEFYTGREDFNNIKQRCFSDTELVFASQKERKTFESLLKELWDEVKNDYDYNADQSRGPLRSRLLNILDEINMFIRSLDIRVVDPVTTAMELNKLAQPASVVTQLITGLNSRKKFIGLETAGLEAAIGELGSTITSLIKQAEAAISTSSKKQKAVKGRKKGRNAKPPLYLLKITLKGSKPPIWRRVSVPGNMTLANLHQVIQETMGWENYHLHGFEIQGERYGVVSQEEPVFPFEQEEEDESAVTLDELGLEPGDSFGYEYDFGDSWEHTIKVEKILPPENTSVSTKQKVVCIAGKRACPPEDCGGLWGYYEMLEALADPKHEEHERWAEWIDKFDPEKFDIDQVNRRLAKRFK